MQAKYGKMTGLYIHIPFCSSRCVYCGFYSTTRTELRQAYIDALCRELEMRTQGICFDTVYIGGGTPSLLTAQQLEQISQHINKVENAEVTIEVNPDDVTTAYAQALRQTPVNRISMGAQTFDNERLHFLRRRHTSEQVSLAVNRLRGAGFGNISIDLMYGFPNQTLEEWKRDIDEAIELDVEHISTYCLMYEEGTPLYSLLEQGEVSVIDEELERNMYYTLIERLEQAGYEHYEISNFARPGYRSRHNSSYWHRIPYIGVGASAHSFDIKTRSWNVADIHQYIEGMHENKRIFEWEEINEDTSYNDSITVALRTCEGLDLSTLTPQQRHHCLANAKRYIEAGWLKLNHEQLALTKEGLFVSDMIMIDLMMI